MSSIPSTFSLLGWKIREDSTEEREAGAQENVEYVFGTIFQVDIWVENVMFHSDVSNGSLGGVKFVNFATYSYKSPMTDLIFFVMISIAETVLLSHFDPLFQVCYERFVKTLQKVNSPRSHRIRSWGTVFKRIQMNEPMLRPYIARWCSRSFWW